MATTKRTSTKENGKAGTFIMRALPFEGRPIPTAAAISAGFTALLAIVLLGFIVPDLHKGEKMIQRIGSPCRSAFEDELSARGLSTTHLIQKTRFAVKHPRSKTAAALIAATEDEECRTQVSVIAATCALTPLCTEIFSVFGSQSQAQGQKKANRIKKDNPSSGQVQTPGSGSTNQVDNHGGSDNDNGSSGGNGDQGGSGENGGGTTTTTPTNNPPPSQQQPGVVCSQLPIICDLLGPGLKNPVNQVAPGLLSAKSKSAFAIALLLPKTTLRKP